MPCTNSSRRSSCVVPVSTTLDAAPRRLARQPLDRVGGGRIDERHRREVDRSARGAGRRCGRAPSRSTRPRRRRRRRRCGRRRRWGRWPRPRRRACGRRWRRRRGPLSTKAPMRLDRGRLRHAVDEEHRAEREADDDRLGQVAEDREQERRHAARPHRRARRAAGWRRRASRPCSRRRPPAPRRGSPAG